MSEQLSRALSDLRATVDEIAARIKERCLLNVAPKPRNGSNGSNLLGTGHSSESGRYTR